MLHKLFYQFGNPPTNLDELSDYYKLNILAMVLNGLILLNPILILTLLITNRFSDLELLVLSLFIWVGLRYILSPRNLNTVSILLILISYLNLIFWIWQLEYTPSTIAMVLLGQTFFITIFFEKKGLIIAGGLNTLIYGMVLLNFGYQWWPKAIPKIHASMWVWFIVALLFITLTHMYNRRITRLIMNKFYEEIERRKVIEGELVRRDAQYKLVTDTALDVTFHYNVDQGRYLYATPSILGMLGRSTDQIHTKDLPKMVNPPEAYERIIALFKSRAASLKNGTLKNNHFTEELEMIHADGHLVPVEITTTLCLNKDGTVALIGTIRDVTVRKQDQAVIFENEKNLAIYEEREQMGRMLHDELGQVFNFVASTSQTAQLLLRKGRSDEVNVILEKNAEISLRSLQQVRSFITQLMKRDIPKPAESLKDSLTNLLEGFRKTHGIKTLFSYSKELPDNPLDGDRIEAVLRVTQEALNNVAKHANASFVSISVQGSEKNIFVNVVDDGQGFDKRRRKAEMDKDPVKHFGLAIMIERMENAGGKFEVISRLGKGTQVLLTMPINPAKGRLLDEARQQRYLLVDDHPLFLDAMQYFLTNHGLNVVGTAISGQDGIEKALSLKPSVVLMDLNMHPTDGVEAAREIHKADPTIKVVMLTAYEGEAKLEEAFRAGAVGSIQKTQNSEALLEALGKLLQQGK